MQPFHSFTSSHGPSFCRLFHGGDLDSREKRRDVLARQKQVLTARGKSTHIGRSLRLYVEERTRRPTMTLWVADVWPKCTGLIFPRFRRHLRTGHVFHAETNTASLRQIVCDCEKALRDSRDADLLKKFQLQLQRCT